ncbi:hypothetical protein [Planctomicrobium piriforme]|uniref:Uncharacterized protein n=1 Tax=Planctomicrobium piriforme TaxID=1576369 RepID=A0A1I3R871_9PLAN|nr:hypothetical protein [Planctomicrobium piriforme]SFJ42230.1 hypothetical protein SAMN05421753_12031 [Planctomicrobium piriforme]
MKRRKKFVDSILQYQLSSHVELESEQAAIRSSHRSAACLTKGASVFMTRAKIADAGPASVTSTSTV